MTRHPYGQDRMQDTNPLSCSRFPSIDGGRVGGFILEGTDTTDPPLQMPFIHFFAVLCAFVLIRCRSRFLLSVPQLFTIIA